MADQKQTARRLIGDVTPKLVKLTEQILFGNIRERPGLVKRDRGLVTITALIALNRMEQLRYRSTHK